MVLGALSSSPVHRALVLVLGTNIAVLLDCSKSSKQCSLPYLLTYWRRERERERERDGTNAVPPHLRRDVFRSRRYGLHAWRLLLQFGRALLRINREHSPGSRCSGDPTDVRPRVASLVVSQALWICSLQGGGEDDVGSGAAGLYSINYYCKKEIKQTTFALNPPPHTHTLWFLFLLNTPFGQT